MARFFNNVIIVMATFFISSAVTAEIISKSIEPASPFDGAPTEAFVEEGSTYNFPPEPAPALRDFLKNCAKQLTGECGKEIFTNIFKDKTNYSEECCGKLVSMGKRCHDQLVKYILTFPEIKSSATYALPRSAKVWSDCVFVAATASPSPTPSYASY